MAPDLLARISVIRSELFDLVDEIPRSSAERLGDDVSMATVRIQNMANELGVVEELLSARRLAA